MSEDTAACPVPSGDWVAAMREADALVCLCGHGRKAHVCTFISIRCAWCGCNRFDADLTGRVITDSPVSP